MCATWIVVFYYVISTDAFKYLSNYSGPANIRSVEPIKINEWITINAERNRQEGSLVVNNGEAVRGYTQFELFRHPCHIFVSRRVHLFSVCKPVRQHCFSVLIIKVLLQNNYTIKCFCAKCLSRNLGV